MNSRTVTKLVVAACTAFIVAGSAGSAFAETPWETSHPWRDQVNDRLENQNRRIHQERREGELDHRQARQLHREDHLLQNFQRRVRRKYGLSPKALTCRSFFRYLRETILPARICAVGAKGKMDLSSPTYSPTPTALWWMGYLWQPPPLQMQ